MLKRTLSSPPLVFFLQNIYLRLQLSPSAYIYVDSYPLASFSIPKTGGRLEWKADPQEGEEREAANPALLCTLDQPMCPETDSVSPTSRSL